MQAFRTLPRAAAAAAPSARPFSTTTPRALAKMQLIGRLADAPEVLPTSTGREITKYALGVSYGARDDGGNRAVSWFRVSSFLEPGPQRDLLTGLPKGTLVYVEADAKMDSFEVEGSKRNALNLVARNFEVLSRPRPDSQTTGAESDADPAQEPLSGIGAS